MKNTTSRRNFLGSIAVTAAAFTLSPALGFAGESGRAISKNEPSKLVLGMVLFDGFQLLDAFGPLEMFSWLKDKVSIVLIGEKPGLVKGNGGPAVKIDHTFQTAPKVDILMIPGGGGTRREINNIEFIDAYKKLADNAAHVATICTGSAILSKTGIIDGFKATTNKRAFKWVTSQNDKVKWVKEARWVEDGKFFTSSGVSAGTDMALALIQKLFGHDEAVRIANAAEYEWQQDPNHDPFAKINGLTD